RAHPAHPSPVRGERGHEEREQTAPSRLPPDEACDEREVRADFDRERDHEERREKRPFHEASTSSRSPSRDRARTSASQRAPLPRMIIATHTSRMTVTTTFTRPIVYVSGLRIIGT